MHNSRGIPRIVIGPDHCVLWILLLYIFLVSLGHYKAYSAILKMGADRYFIYLGIPPYIAAIILAIYTVLANPGIPESVFLSQKVPYNIVQDQENEQVN